jgi:hypothetical protein
VSVIKLAAMYAAFLLAVVGGGFVNARAGTTGVILYGVAVLGLIALLAFWRRQSR